MVLQWIMKKLICINALFIVIMRSRLVDYFPDSISRQIGRKIDSYTISDGTKANSEYTCDLDQEIIYEELIQNSAKDNGNIWYFAMVSQEDNNPILTRPFPNLIRNGNANTNCDYDYSHDGSQFRYNFDGNYLGYTDTDRWNTYFVDAKMTDVQIVFDESFLKLHIVDNFEYDYRMYQWQQYKIHLTIRNARYQRADGNTEYVDEIKLLILTLVTRVTANYECDINTDIIQSAQNLMTPVIDTSFESRLFISNGQIYLKVATSTIYNIFTPNSIQYTNMNQYQIESDSFAWKYIGLSPSGIDLMDYDSVNQIITINFQQIIGQNALQFVKMPLLTVDGNQISNCNYQSNLQQTTHWGMDKSIDIFIQQYSSVCETFQIDWSQSNYQNELFTFNQATSDSDIDLDISKLATLNYLANSPGSDSDKLSCSNFQYEIQARNDESNQFTECLASNFNDQSSSKKLCHQSGINFEIVNKNILRITPNNQLGLFQFYLWTYLVDASNDQTIYNMRASKLQISMIEAQVESESSNNIEENDSSTISDAVCIFEIKYNQSLPFDHNMSYLSTDTSLIKLTKFVNVSNNCTASNYKLNFQLKLNGYTKHIQFDDSNLEIKIITNTDNQHYFNGSSQIIIIRIDLVNIENRNNIQSDYLNIFVQYSNISKQIDDQNELQSLEKTQLDQQNNQAIKGQLHQGNHGSADTYIDDDNNQLEFIRSFSYDSYLNQLVQIEQSEQISNKLSRNNQQQKQQSIVRIERVSQEGLVDLKFSGNLQKLNASSITNYTEELTLAIYSPKDRTITLGRYKNNVNNSTEYTTQSRINIQNSDSKKEFDWSVKLNQSNEILLKIQLEFKNSSLISVDSEFYDQVFVLFRKHQDLGFISALIPPQLDQKSLKAVQSYGQTIVNVINTTSFVIIIQQFLFGGLLQQIIAIVSTLSIINLILMIDYKYNPRLLNLLKYCVKAASIDIIDGPSIYASLFKFKDTGPFNTIFQFFEISDLNIMMNSSSLPIIFISFILLGVIYKILILIAILNYKIKSFRKIGMFLDKRNELIQNILAFIMANYQDLVMATSFSLYATFSYRYSQSVSEWFETPDDTFCQILTFITCITLLIMPTLLYKRIIKLENDQKASVHSDKLLIDFKLNKKDQGNKINLHGLAIYIMIDFVLKLQRPVILLCLDGYQVIQSQSFLIQFFFQSALLLHLRPYTSQRDQRVQLINNQCLYIINLCQILYRFDGRDEQKANDQRQFLDLVFEFVILANFTFNFLYVAIQAIYDNIRRGLVYRNKHLKRKILNKKFQHRQRIIKQNLSKQISHSSEIKDELNELMICAEYARERNWCIKHRINVSNLNEEKLFQNKRSAARYTLFLQFSNLKDHIDRLKFEQQVNQQIQSDQLQTKDNQMIQFQNQKKESKQAREIEYNQIISKQLSLHQQSQISANQIGNIQMTINAKSKQSTNQYFTKLFVQAKRIFAQQQVESSQENQHDLKMSQNNEKMIDSQKDQDQIKFDMEQYQQEQQLFKGSEQNLDDKNDKVKNLQQNDNTIQQKQLLLKNYFQLMKDQVLIKPIQQDTNTQLEKSDSKNKIQKYSSEITKSNIEINSNKREKTNKKRVKFSQKDVDKIQKMDLDFLNDVKDLIKEIVNDEDNQNIQQYLLQITQDKPVQIKQQEIKDNQSITDIDIPIKMKKNQLYSKNLQNVKQKNTKQTAFENNEFTFQEDQKSSSVTFGQDEQLDDDQIDQDFIKSVQSIRDKDVKEGHNFEQEQKKQIDFEDKVKIIKENMQTNDADRNSQFELNNKSPEHYQDHNESNQQQKSKINDLSNHEIFDLIKSSDPLMQQNIYSWLKMQQFENDKTNEKYQNNERIFLNELKIKKDEQVKEILDQKNFMKGKYSIKAIKNTKEFKNAMNQTTSQKHRKERELVQKIRKQYAEQELVINQKQKEKKD